MKIFVTGASGYIGGSVAHRLKEQGHHVLGLVRTKEKAAQLEARGIEALLGSLDDAEALRSGAINTDATVNAASSDHFFAVKMLTDALAGSGKALIHTSGSSIVCDDARGDSASEKIFEDETAFTPMAHRAARVEIDRIVRTAGVQRGMRACVVCPTMIYGKGTGLQEVSDQIPKLAKKSQERGVGLHLGKGLNIWSNVFIGDLVDLYMLALEKAPSGSFFFAENGEWPLKSVSESISKSLGFGGRTEAGISTKRLRKWGGGHASRWAPMPESELPMRGNCWVGFRVGQRLTRRCGKACRAASSLSDEVRNDPFPRPCFVPLERSPAARCAIER